jgi:aspartate/methionine/tyrosine aminotransferase
MALFDLRPDPGLPVPQYWEKHLTADAPHEPVGGGPELRGAAAGYWERRGLPTDPRRVVAGPGAEPLLLALLAVTGGDVVVARPAATWHPSGARLLGRRVFAVQTPAEGGGAPDPFALLETIRRAREEGADVRVLVLSAADDPTGTVTPPELLHEVCEAAVGAGLLIVSDETYHDTVHDHGHTVLLSPAEMIPDRVIVLTDLAAGLAPAGRPVAVARFPTADLSARTLLACADLRSVLPAPVASAVTYSLAEPEEVRAFGIAATRLHATVTAAAHHVVTAAGALCRPPEAGFYLYADFGPLRSGRTTSAAALERDLTALIGRPVPGGHRFGDDPAAPRVRIDTGPLHGDTDDERRAALESADPLVLPHVAAALGKLATALTPVPGVSA